MPRVESIERPLLRPTRQTRFSVKRRLLPSVATSLRCAESRAAAPAFPARALAGSVAGLARAADDRENSVSASGSLLLFMEAGVFGSPRPWGGQRAASGPLGMAVAEGKPPRGFQARRAVRSHVRPGALDNVAEPPLGVARAGRDVYDPHKDWGPLRRPQSSFRAPPCRPAQ